MVSEEFTKQYERLSKKQKEAVDTIDGPVMVIAGPGTGKTTILTLRIAKILKETDTPASGILALTFTEVGVRNMRIKLREIIETRADEVHIHTFHSFARSVINEFEDHFLHLYRNEQITEVEAESIIREILKQKEFSKLRPLGEPDFYIYKILQTISECKKEAWTGEIIESFAEEEIKRIETSEDSVSTRGMSKGKLKAEAEKRIEKCQKTILFAKVYREYEERKRLEKKIDFDDLIFELVLALKRDRLLLQLLQEKYLYMLVDEHQDTNDAQNLLIQTIADFFENPNLFVVGDEKQAIYRFQGASVQNFLYFEKRWKDIKVINLEDNYRSHQSILDASFKMIEENYGQGEYEKLRIKLKASKSIKNRPIEIINSPDTDTEISFISKNIKEILESEGTESIAIIVRKNKEVREILSALEKNNISAYAERGINVFNHPVGIILFELLEYILDPSKIESFGKTVGYGLWNLDIEKQREILLSIKKDDFETIKKTIPEVEFLLKKISNTETLEYFEELADISGLTKIITRSAESSEVWRDLFALIKDIVVSKKVSDPVGVIKTLLDYKKSAEKRILKINSGKRSSRVNILTAHSSKGLEFDYVFIPFATEESWINKRKGDFFLLPREKENEEIRDERRLFYVALTRAKKHITISFSENDTSKTLTPLRFLSEMDKDHLLHKKIQAIETKSTIKKIEDIKSKEFKNLIEYSQNTLLEKGLSVTALNHFLNCPSEFLYKSILKLPEAPSATGEKGNAMHEAMARVWKQKERSVKDITKTIIQTTSEYINKSLLPKFERESILEEIRESAPIVATALGEHFHSEGEVFVENWFEREHEYEVEEEKIKIRLHGKLDSVINQADRVLVFDYKTALAKSVNEIRGETKNSDGDYFRQLVFYKILLAENMKFRGKSIEPSLVFIKPRPKTSSSQADTKSRCPIIKLDITKIDEQKVKLEIDRLLASVWSGDFLKETCDNKECEYCALKRLAL